jgi:hypothetical protein
MEVETPQHDTAWESRGDCTRQGISSLAAVLLHVAQALVCADSAPRCAKCGTHAAYIEGGFHFVSIALPHSNVLGPYSVCYHQLYAATCLAVEPLLQR